MVSEFMKFRILWRKNWTIQWKYKAQLIFEILLPLIISLILIIVRKSFDNFHHNEYRYNDFDTDCNLEELNSSVEFNNVIAYSPRNNSELKAIVKRVNDEINAFSHIKFTLVEEENAYKLNEYLKLENPLVGVEFKDDMIDKNELPKNLEYTLRFRQKELFSNWRTDKMQNLQRFQTVRIDNDIYKDHCFLMIQNIIDEYFITKVSDGSHKFNPHLQKFAEKEFTESKSYLTMIYVLPLMLIINFTFAVDNIITNVALEKEKNIKIFLKVSGLTKTMQWRAWFAKAFCMNLYSITMYSILLTGFIGGSQSSTLFYHSNSFLIWLFLIFYLVSIVSFGFLMSLFFKKAKISSAVGIIIFLVFYLPYNMSTIAVEYLDNYTAFPHFLMSLMTNSGLGFGFNTIFALEWKGDGLLWSTLFTRVNNYGLSVGEVMLCFLLTGVICLFLIAHVEQVFPEFVKPKKWYTPLVSLYKQTAGSQYETLEDINPTVFSNENFERDPSNDQVNIKVVGLSKIFKRKKRVIDNLNLNIYESQITVFLGQDGAGKTTLMNLLCGVQIPDSGTAYVLGKDVRKDLKLVREHMGVSFQQLTLFERLTVQESLSFFCQLRDVGPSLIPGEIAKYADALDFKSVLGMQIKGLKPHMKRKISIAIALCGSSKIVLLDEPTLGLDLEDKKRVWDLLSREKQNKSIVITTSLSDEASLIGDKVALMIDGEIRALGSPNFLRKQFGVGYRLMCVKKENCVPSHIIDLLKNFVPDVELESENEIEITFTLNESYLPRFAEMFDCLENEFYSLKIDSFRISLISLEQAMARLNPIKVDSPEHQLAGSNSNYFGLTDDVPIVNTFDTENSSSPKLLTGPSLLLNHIFAIWKKKLYYIRRVYKFILVNLLITVLAIVLVLFVPEQGETIYPKMPISISDFQNTNVYLMSDNSTQATSYKNLLEKITNVITLPAETNMDDYVIGSGSNFVIGASFNDTNIIGFYKQEYLHSAPLSLNMINRALLKSKNMSDHDIFVANEPFVFADQRSFSLERLYQSANNSPLAFLMSFVYIYWIITFMTPYVKETTSGAKALLFHCGISKVVYWTTCFVFDWIVFSIVAFIVTLVVMMFHAEFFLLGLTNFTVVSIFFATSALPMMYLISISSKESFNGKMNLVLIALFTGMIPFIMGLFVIVAFHSIHMGGIIYGISQLSPYFVLFDVIGHFRFKNDNDYVNFYCEILGMADCSKQNVCKLIGRFCDYSYLERIVVGKILIFLLTGVFYFMLLIAKEQRWFGKKSKKNFNLISDDAPNSTDDDISTEYERVMAMPAAEVQEYGLVIKNLSGAYAVRNISLAIEENSCVGFVGSKFSGNSDLLRILACEERIESGDVYIKNHTINLNRNLLKAKIGYCPPQDAFFKYLTGRENLEIYGLIKGISRNFVQKEIRSLGDALMLTSSLDTLSRDYNGGTRRKLSSAIAVMGDPQIVLLDNVMSELDTNSKKKFVSFINKAKFEGRSIILAECDFTNCEVVCNKIAVMNEGALMHLGSPQHLRNKFSQGININIKMKPHQCIERSVLMVNIKDFVERSFSKINSFTEFMNDLTYNIDNSDLRWSEILSTLEDLKEKFAVESYSITESSLDQFSQSNSHRNFT